MRSFNTAHMTRILKIMGQVIRTKHIPSINWVWVTSKLTNKNAHKVFDEMLMIFST
ncbi:hypothetical protein LINPERHAP1_LOCUS10640 [Linum perenne]